jgi:hypothetical protein
MFMDSASCRLLIEKSICCRVIIHSEVQFPCSEVCSPLLNVRPDEKLAVTVCLVCVTDNNVFPPTI